MKLSQSLGEGMDDQNSIQNIAFHLIERICYKWKQRKEEKVFLGFSWVFKNVIALLST